MKTSSEPIPVQLPHDRKSAYSIFGSLTALAAGLALLGGQSKAIAQADDFNDGNDTFPTVAWTRYDALNTIFGGAPLPLFPAPQDTWSFPGGNTYRLQALANPIPAGPPVATGPARVSSFAPNVYTDFYQSIDVVGVNNTGGYNVFGMIARAGDFSTAGSATTRGYIFVYVPGSVAGDRNYIAIARLHGDASTSGVPGSSGGNAEVNVTLDPTKQYRMVFMGHGTHLEGRVYALTDLTTPIAVVSANTATDGTQYASGQSGIIAFSLCDNPVTGLYLGAVDVTFDNYFAAADCPVTLYADDFNDGNDTTPPPAWVHYDPIGGVTAPPATYTFPGGNSYRIIAPVPSAPDAGPARAAAVRPDRDFSDFFLSVDLLAWSDTQRQAFGLFGRGSNLGLGTTDGYLFSYELGSGALPNPTGGGTDISNITGEQANGVNYPAGQDRGIHLVPGRKYRMTFVGSGTNFTGKIYDITDSSSPSSPLITTVGSDDAYTSGQVGLIVASQASDAGSPTVTGDATFDNFVADVAEPRLLLNGSSGSAVVSWPGDLTCIWVLESSPAVGPAAVWTEIPAANIVFSPATIQNTYTATATMNTTGNTFYRLRKL